ncbi:AAA family ATPase [Paraeggerthella hongkongensis]|uniref:ATP-binding protein n=1 Tax=Paraeggerthella hominis TaxID=2897351 RepID=UPI001C104F7F|nr:MULTISPECIES: AAA family ATPase [Paraeggerthella]MBU5405543.1 AAA family ATPase [Paraeggerthella hongkongensis]MCD2432638.1 AAA family ATPase [Paraeggerthella hominis]
MTRPYLERVKIASFGAFSNMAVGPLTPGLNVIFGRNESGKTTLASFVGGVLFGWEDARGMRNTYKPANAERAGSLFFQAGGNEIELSRGRNADGLQGDAALASDIDKETFQTMFSLTSDELRTLRNTSDVTAKLLTAGSGTGASPAHARSLIQNRLAEYTSRAAGIEHSLVNLGVQQDELREKLSYAAETVERFKRQDKEFHDLAPQRDQLLARLDSLNSDIEALTVCRASVEKIDQEMDDLEDKVASLRAEEETLRLEHRLRDRGDSAALVRLTTTEDRALRDKIESLAVDEAKFEHAVDLAQDNFSTSKAAYEVLLESEDATSVQGVMRRQRATQIVLSIALPLLFMLSGVPLFIHGREITSLSFTVGGIGLIVFAIMLALAAMVMLFRPDKKADAKEERLQDAQWVMLQDKKKLEACVESRESFRREARAQLDSVGLEEAQGSLRRARTLLDEAKDARAESNLYRQRQQALVSRRSSLEESLALAKRQRKRLFERIDSRAERTVEALDAALAQKVQQRSGLLETSEHLNRRYGELKQELSHAVKEREFDALKLQAEEVKTRIDESSREYARLLLAKRMLETAIGAWESKSQPEVYRQASRLLSVMTDGAWVKVAMTAEGRLQVVDAVKTARDPLHLSLGTCQQLYLALRIALLMTADNVGRAIPILADDILVNFDSERRAGAARALAELARMRQVLLFTCHEEVVKALRAVDPALNKLEL